MGQQRVQPILRLQTGSARGWTSALLHLGLDCRAAPHASAGPFAKPPDKPTAAVAASLLDGVPGLPTAAASTTIAGYMAAAHMAVIAQNTRCGGGRPCTWHDSDLGMPRPPHTHSLRHRLCTPGLRYLELYDKHNHTTSKSFLDYVKLFKGLLGKKQQEHLTSMQRLQGGAGEGCWISRGFWRSADGTHQPCMLVTRSQSLLV